MLQPVTDVPVPARVGPDRSASAGFDDQATFESLVDDAMGRVDRNAPREITSGPPADESSVDAEDDIADDSADVVTEPTVGSSTAPPVVNAFALVAMLESQQEQPAVDTSLAIDGAPVVVDDDAGASAPLTSGAVAPTVRGGNEDGAIERAEGMRPDAPTPNLSIAPTGDASPNGEVAPSSSVNHATTTRSDELGAAANGTALPHAPVDLEAPDPDAWQDAPHLSTTDAPFAETPAPHAAGVTPVPPSTPATTAATGATPAPGDTSAATATDGAEPPPWSQIAHAVRSLRHDRDGSHTMTVRLDPPELGSVDIEVRVRDGLLSVHATVDTASTRDLLTRAMPDLRNALESSGLPTASLDVGARSGSSPHGDPGANGAGAPRRPDDRESSRTASLGDTPPARAGHAASGRVDLRL